MEKEYKVNLTKNKEQLHYSYWRKQGKRYDIFMKTDREDWPHGDRDWWREYRYWCPVGWEDELDK